MRSITRGAAIAAGTLCVGIGVVGIFIPLLPTTPFLLLAALLLARSSRRGHRWLMTNRLFGPTLRRHLEERRMSRLHKAATLVFLWGDPWAIGRSRREGPVGESASGRRRRGGHRACAVARSWSTSRRVQPQDGDPQRPRLGDRVRCRAGRCRLLDQCRCLVGMPANWRGAAGCRGRSGSRRS